MHTDKDEVYGSKTLYRELGYYISRLEQYERSLKVFDLAVKKTPDDKRALIGRSVSRAKAIQCAGALEDINKALHLDPNDLVVLAHKALNTYLTCEFEEGLVQNCRLRPLREKPDNFELGIMQCSDAIENCVGERTGRPLRDHFKIIRRLAWKKNHEAQKPFEPKPKYKSKKKKLKASPEHITSKKKASSKIRDRDLDSNELEVKDSLHSKQADELKIPPLAQPYPHVPMQNYTSNIENYMAERYLDSMYLDKIFLKELQSLPGTVCPNKKGSQKIKQLAKNGYKTVSYKQEVMRTRRPFYFIKYHEATISGNLRKRQAEELEMHKATAKKEADAILAKLHEAFNQKRLTDILELAEKLKQYCDSKQRKILPNKDTYMGEVHDKVCRGFYETYRVNDMHSEGEQEDRIRGLLGLQTLMDPSTDSVLGYLRDSFVDFKKEIDMYERRLENTVVPMEICWYYYGLARDYVELKKFELARVYIRKCIKEGELFDILHWQFNGIMLLLRCNIYQRFKNDAQNDLKEATKIVKKLKDKDLESFLKKCKPIVDTLDLANLPAVSELVEKREQKIINIMNTSEMKAEVAHLFSQMSSMPSSRRMNIMPGVVPGKDKNARKSLLEKRSARMSIKPTSKDPTDDVDEHIKDKPPDDGAEFMHLIQYHV